ncbi:MAG TPA: acetyl-CoA carboxylase biotin carboxyl carrier protein [Bacteriovoracaceae bacterium]|nr:acetyl-CoA carboxylase biotin carboxyl carrier protein [Bacteriovoracaceae bacterium]
MDTKALREIVKIAREHGVAELKVHAKDMKVKVSFVSGVATPQVTVSTPSLVQPISAPINPAPATPAKAVNSDAGLHIVKSPFVGTFYNSPAPGKPSYVKVGDKVIAGQTLCILEAMKIMNEIDADVAGEIVEICCENESLVEFDQPLFKIRKN